MEKVVNFFFNIVFFNVAQLFGFGDKIYLPLAIAVLICGYIYVMVRLKFIQFTKFGKMLSYTFNTKNKNDKQPSSIKTLLTSMASCTGMNATAGMVFMVAIGGIGTIFWLPILALLSMPFRFAEVWLSHSYRSQNNSSAIIGGPFDYIKKGLTDIGFRRTGKILSLSYAFLMIITGVIGVSLYEMNQAVVVFEKSFSVLNGKRMILSTIFTIISVWVLLGGTKRVENFMSIALPTLSITYIFVSLIVIVANYQNFGNAIVAIFNDAMHPKSIAGGFIGSFCICARKCALSHETGLGTSGIVHALSLEKDSIKEATRSMMTPFITGFVVCLASALVLITTDTYQNADIMKDGVPAIAYSFGKVCKIFSYIVVIIIPMFTINVMIGWSNYVMKCTQYICKNKKIVVPTMTTFFIFAFLGGVMDDFLFIMNTIDTLLMLILLINVPVVIVLTGKVLKAVKNYKF